MPLGEHLDRQSGGPKKQHRNSSHASSIAPRATSNIDWAI